jgi:3-hydroxyisobutyrate dehydrogenase-like beta-hydroxyacid dehydrogenase
MTIEIRDQTVGFLGLGMMGAPMAANILKAGLPLVAYDVDSTKNDRIAALGAKIASGPADVAHRAQIVVSMVDTTAQAEEVIVGTNGIISAASPGDVVLSMSTIDPLALRRIERQLHAKGIALLDAPVSGMEQGAKQGTLKAFVGGEVAALEKCTPVLKTMASQILHLGPIGQGTVMKLVNNMLIQVGWVLAAEALVLGAKAGLDSQTMIDVIGDATGNSVAFQYLAPRAVARNFDGIRMDITYKDVELQTQLAKSLNVPMFLANVAQQVYQMGKASGYGSEDGSAIIKIYEQLAGVTLGKEG